MLEVVLLEGSARTDEAPKTREVAMVEPFIVVVIARWNGK